MGQDHLQGITINSYIQYQQHQLANKALENVEDGRLKTKNSSVDRTLSNSPPHKIGRMHSKYDRANIENAKNLKTGFKNSVEEIRPRFVPKMKIYGERIVAKRPPVVHKQVYAEVNELLDLTASGQSPNSYEAMQPHEPSPYPSCDQSEQYLFLRDSIRVKAVERTLDESEGGPFTVPHPPQHYVAPMPGGELLSHGAASGVVRSASVMALANHLVEPDKNRRKARAIVISERSKDFFAILKALKKYNKPFAMTRDTAPLDLYVG